MIICVAKCEVAYLHIIYVNKSYIELQFLQNKCQIKTWINFINRYIAFGGGYERYVQLQILYNLPSDKTFLFAFAYDQHQNVELILKH